jgi:hypothetical protein
MKTQRNRKKTKRKSFGSCKVPMRQSAGAWYKLFWKLSPEQAVTIYKLRLARFNGLVLYKN